MKKPRRTPPGPPVPEPPPNGQAGDDQALLAIVRSFKADEPRELIRRLERGRRPGRPVPLPQAPLLRAVHTVCMPTSEDDDPLAGNYPVMVEIVITRAGDKAEPPDVWQSAAGWIHHSHGELDVYIRTLS